MGVKIDSIPKPTIEPLHPTVEASVRKLVLETLRECVGEAQSAYISGDGSMGDEAVDRDFLLYVIDGKLKELTEEA